MMSVEVRRRATRVVEKPIWMVCTTHMFVEVFLLTQVALIPVIVREFQLSLLEASLVAAVPSLVALFMNIPSGLLADRVSANRLLCIAMTIEGLSALLVSRSSSFWGLVVALSVMQIASPLYHASGLTQVTRIAGREHLSMAMGLHNALGNLGAGAGVVSLAILLSLGWRWAYLLWAVPMLIWGVMILISPRLSITASGRQRDGSARSSSSTSSIFCYALLIFLIVISLREVGSTSITTFMTTYLVKSRNVSESIASLIFGSGPFVGIIGSLVGGYIGIRVGTKKALIWAILGSAVSLSILGLLTDTTSLTLTFLVYAFFGYAVWSPLNALMAEITPLATRGLGYSIVLFVDGLMASATPVLAAGVIELLGIWVIFPFSVVFLVTSVFVLQLLDHPHRQRAPS
jgi:FSR family fosmidomycin resistance protein-like MFS transporter